MPLSKMIIDLWHEKVFFDPDKITNLWTDPRSGHTCLRVDGVTHMTQMDVEEVQQILGVDQMDESRPFSVDPDDDGDDPDEFDDDEADAAEEFFRHDDGDEDSEG